MAEPRYGLRLLTSRTARQVTAAQCKRTSLGFQSVASAQIILGGIEMIHMMRKRQAKYARDPPPSLAEQFNILAA